MRRLEKRPIVTSTASPEEPVVKVLGVGYREGEGMNGGPMCRCDAQGGKDVQKETHMV